MDANKREYFPSAVGYLLLVITVRRQPNAFRRGPDKPPIDANLFNREWIRLGWIVAEPAY
jgi:hypothetical protein